MKKNNRLLITLILSLSSLTLAGCGPSGPPPGSHSLLEEPEWVDPNQDPLTGQRVRRRRIQKPSPTPSASPSENPAPSLPTTQVVLTPGPDLEVEVTSDWPAPTVTPAPVPTATHTPTPAPIPAPAPVPTVAPAPVPVPTAAPTTPPSSWPTEPAPVPTATHAPTPAPIPAPVPAPVPTATATPPPAASTPAPLPLYSYETEPNFVQAVGYYANGGLKNPIELPDSGLGYVRYAPDRDRAWGTTDMVSLIRNVGEAFFKAFPIFGPIRVGDISIREGGKVPGSLHASHQNGLDADLYYVKNPKTKKFDMQGTLDLFKLFVASNRVARIFVSPTMKQNLCSHAKAQKIITDPLTAKALHFLAPIPRHEGHFHLRITCPQGSLEECDDQTPLPAGTRC